MRRSSSALFVTAEDVIVILFKNSVLDTSSADWRDQWSIPAESAAAGTRSKCAGRAYNLLFGVIKAPKRHLASKSGLLVKRNRDLLPGLS